MYKIVHNYLYNYWYDMFWLVYNKSVISGMFIWKWSCFKYNLPPLQVLKFFVSLIMLLPNIKAYQKGFLNPLCLKLILQIDIFTANIKENTMNFVQRERSLQIGSEVMVWLVHYIVYQFLWQIWIVRHKKIRKLDDNNYINCVYNSVHVIKDLRFAWSQNLPTSLHK